MKTLCILYFLNETMPLWTFLTGVGAIGALIFYGFQQSQNKRASRSNFWLKLEELFSDSRRDTVHMKIMDKKFGEKLNEEDSSYIDDYLGILEICLIMLKQKVIDMDTFKAIYKYRLEYLIDYEMIVKEKLIKEGNYYKKLFELFSMVSGDKGWEDFWKTKIEDKNIESPDIDKLYKQLKGDLIDKFKK
jgi:hypothetical protein